MVSGCASEDATEVTARVTSTAGRARSLEHSKCVRLDELAGGPFTKMNEQPDDPMVRATIDRARDAAGLKSTAVASRR